MCSKARRFSEDLARHAGVVENERKREVELKERVVVGSLGAMAAVCDVLRSVGEGLGDQQGRS